MEKVRIKLRFYDWTDDMKYWHSYFEKYFVEHIEA